MHIRLVADAQSAILTDAMSGFAWVMLAIIASVVFFVAAFFYALKRQSDKLDDKDRQDDSDDVKEDVAGLFERRDKKARSMRNQDLEAWERPPDWWKR